MTFQKFEIVIKIMGCDTCKHASFFTQVEWNVFLYIPKWRYLKKVTFGYVGLRILNRH